MRSELPAGAGSPGRAATTRSFRLGPTTTAFRAQPELARVLERWLPSPGGGDGPAADLRFELAVRRPPAPPELPPTMSDGILGLWRGHERLTVRLGNRAGGTIDLAAGMGDVWAAPGDPVFPWQAIHHCLRPLWFTALGRFGLFQLHASAVAGRRGAVVVIGDTGSGKSTLAARLGGLGAAPLSDDTVFVEDAGALTVHGLGDAPRLAAGARSLLGATAAGALPDDPDGKVPTGPPPGVPNPATPALLVLLEATPAGGTPPRRTSPAGAMTRLLLSASLTLDPPTDAARVRALARLAGSCPAIVLRRTSPGRSRAVLLSILEHAGVHPVAASA